MLPGVVNISERGRLARSPLPFALALAILLLALVPAARAEVISGGPAPETLTGTPQADSVYGRAGGDSVFGKGGPDRLVGGRGADTLTGGPGPDRLFGGPGSDRILARDGVADVVDCGPGWDVAVVDPIDQVSGDCEVVNGGAEDTAPPAPPAPRVPDAPSGPVTPPEPPPVQEEPFEPIPAYEENPLAMFPAGHGWTGNEFGTFTDAGPPFVVNNDRSFQITTDGLGDESVATSPELEPVDLTRSHVSFQAEVSFSARLGAVKLRLSSGDIETDYAEATVWQEGSDPVILGSSFDKQSIPTGAFHVVGNVDWSKIDRAQIILTDQGSGPVTLYVAGIYAVPTYRQATISFAFDDGLASTYELGLKKLSAFRYPASAYVIADAIGTPNFMTMEQLDTMRDKDNWEIGGHAATIANHNLPNGFDSLEPEALKEEMNKLRDWLDENGFARKTFAYPKGAAGEGVRHYAARDYCAARVTAAAPETIPPRDPYTIRGWSVNGLETDAEDIEEAVDKAVAEKSWLIITFHQLVNGPPVESTDFNYGDFSKVVDYVHTLQAKKSLKVRTIADAVGC